jgi:hypothetical protein
MNKLTTHLTIILIGLSLIILTACPFRGDAPDEHYNQDFANTSNEEISLIFNSVRNKGLNDTLIIEPNQRETRIVFVATEKEAVENAVYHLDYDDYNVSIYINGELKKSWEGPPAYKGDSINSPFNYDSWELELNGSDSQNKGAVVFTISNSDIE